MISLCATPINDLPDEEVKKSAALKQMEELVSRLQSGPKYHTLTASDRALLIKEGYASDLVNNLVFMTQRLTHPVHTLGSSPVTHDDHVKIGFTYAAFDPALYASNTVAEQVKQRSKGCCALCESDLTATESGAVSHFRPVKLLDDIANDGKTPHTTYSPYYALAYQHDNLLYVCKACDEQHKAGLFPVIGKRFPDTPLDEEQAILIHPYREQPRDFIRFNPLNGQAFAYDQLSAFLMASRQLSSQEAELLIWTDPRVIPEQHATSTPISDDFQQWHEALPSDQQQLLSRGQISIDTYGLNRPALVNARQAHINQLLSLYEAHKKLFSNEATITLDDIPVSAYRSLSIDVFNYWNTQQNVDKSKKQSTPKPLNIEPDYRPSPAPIAMLNYPTWLRSCLVYCVGESELQQQQKRRLVMLSGQDAHFGKKPIEKSVFLAIDWQRDQHKIVKVKSHRNIWETSFSELANTRPQELTHLFSQNEVWIEGDFSSLQN